MVQITQESKRSEGFDEKAGNPPMETADAEDQ